MKNRYTVDTNDAGTARLEETRVATRRETKVDVIRDALAMWHMLREQAEQGNQVFISKDKNEMTQLFVEPLDIARKSHSTVLKDGDIHMNVRAIHTTDDHDWALAEIESLWNKAEPGTPEGDRFEVLSILIDTYEREHFPVPLPDPVEAKVRIILIFKKMIKQFRKFLN